MMSPEDLAAARAFADLAMSSPFSGSRAVSEAVALGEAGGMLAGAARGKALSTRVQGLVERARALWGVVPRQSAQDLSLYERLVRYYLADRLGELLQSLSQAAQEGALTRRRVSSYRLFADEAKRLLAGVGSPLLDELPRLFAVLFQRHHVAQLVGDLALGHSRTATEFRQALWHSMFTRDLLRYERAAFEALPSAPTLIWAPVGSDLHAVTRVFAQGRLVVFDESSLRFTEEPRGGFWCGHAAELSHGVLENMLTQDAWTMSPVVEGDTGSARQKERALLLEDVEQLSPSLQATLAQLLQVGSQRHGRDRVAPCQQKKLIAATTGDLRFYVAQGRLREDLYYQLCGDVLRLPPLALLLRQVPEDLPYFVRLVLRALLPEAEVESACDEVVQHIERTLSHHLWPGNLAELAQCARSVLLHGSYQPPMATAELEGAAQSNLAQRFLATDYNAEELLDAYCTLMYKRTGSYLEAARRLGLDRRTVKSRVDETLLAELS